MNSAEMTRWMPYEDRVEIRLWVRNEVGRVVEAAIWNAPASLVLSIAQEIERLRADAAQGMLDLG